MSLTKSSQSDETNTYIANLLRSSVELPSRPAAYSKALENVSAEDTHTTKIVNTYVR
jgi:hypothetical protein